MVSRRFYKDVFLEYGQLILYILKIFKNIYLEQFWAVCFHLFFFYLFSLSYIDIFLYSINFKTHVKINMH